MLLLTVDSPSTRSGLVLPRFCGAGLEFVPPLELGGGEDAEVLRLTVDGAGRCGWELDGDPSSKESLRGRFLVRDDDVRSDARIGDVGGALLGSCIPHSEY